MYNITCIAPFLEIPSFAVSFLTIIFSTYFTCICDRNARFLRGKTFLYMIGFLPIFFKQLATFVQGTGSLNNSKYLSSHIISTIGILSLSSDFFSLDNFSSLHHKFLFGFSAGYSFYLVTVVVS